jgi:hypothetical protein
MKALQFVLVFVLLGGLGYLLWFHSLNRDFLAFPLPVVGAINAPGYVALVLGFVTGVVYASLLYVPNLVRRVVQGRRHQRELRGLREENARLRLALARPLVAAAEAAAPANAPSGVHAAHDPEPTAGDDEPMSDFAAPKPR